MNIGVNLEGNHDWNRADYFANKWMSARKLGSANTPWDGKAVLDAGGFPRNDFGAVVFTDRPGGSGDYIVTVDPPLVNSIFTPACSSKITSIGQSKWQITLGGTTLMVGFTGVSPGIQKVTIEKVGEEGFGAFRWTKVFLAALAPFSGFRCMDLMETNNATQQTWADRPQVTDFTWNREGLGVPLEVLIDLANTASKDLYINIPHGVDDNYITQTALLIKSQLTPGVNLFVEFSNEMWNSSFERQNQWLISKAKSSGIPLECEVVELAVRTSAIMKPILGPRCKIILATQGANTPLQQSQSKYAAKGWGSFKQAGIDCFALAPYMGGSVTATETPAQMIQQFMGQVHQPTQHHLTDAKAIADANGVDLICYECGTDFGGGPNLTGRLAVATSPDMKQAIYDYCMMLSKFCPQIFYYTLTSMFNSSGQWGLTDNVSVQEPKMLGILAAISPTPTPTPLPTPLPTPTPHSNDPQQLKLNALSLGGQLAAAKVAAGQNQQVASPIQTAQQLANNILQITKRLFP